MTRVIKFRSWDRDQKLMLYPGNGKWFMVEPDQEHIVIEMHNKPVTNGCFDTVVARQFYGTLLQFTGLRDKNGVEIYEGDIVREQFDFAEGSSVHFSPIGWCHYTASFSVSFEDEMYADSAKEYMEVVGNIYQNPELLEDDE